MNHTLARIYDETVESLKRHFTPEELYMVLDVMNGTHLLSISGTMGQHAPLNVYDSFRLYPGEYEKKWNVNKDQLLEKFKQLDHWHIAILEIWCARFWEFVSGRGGPGFDHKEYCLVGKFSLQSQHGEAMKHLDESIKKMEESRGAVKSKTIALARSEAEKVKTILENLI